MEEPNKIQLRKKINKNYKYLIRETKLEDLIDGFIAEEVFTYDDRELIMNVQPSTTNERNRKFLDLMFRKGQRALDIFLQELIEHGRGDVVNKIKDTKIQELPQQQSQLKTERYGEPQLLSFVEKDCPSNQLSGKRIQIKTKPSSYITNVFFCFQLDRPVTLVAPIDSSTAWFGCHSESYLRLAAEDGSIIKTVNVNFNVDHIAVDMAGDVLMTVFKGHQIIKLTKSGSIVNVADTAPLQSRGICVNDSGQILVCLSTNDNETGELRKLSTGGEVLQIISYIRGTTATLFRVPFRVKQSVTGDICVLDISILTNNRRLITLDTNGDIKFIYPVNDDPTENYFNPMNIETDSYGNILIGDTSCGIHLLDKNGNFIQFVLSKSYGLEESRGLSTDPKGRLWVCCSGTNRVFILRYDMDEMIPLKHM